MILEFQIQAAAFLAAQKAALQAGKLCPPPPIAVGPVQVVIDHFEFGANALRHNEAVDFSIFYDFLGETTGIDVPGFQTQLAQDVVVYVTSLNEILSHPNGTPATLVPVRGTLVIDMNLFAIDQEVYFQTQFKRMELGPQPFLPPGFDPNNIPLPVTIDQILKIVNDQVPALVNFPTIPLGILSLLPFAPSKLLIVNAGMTVDAQLQRVGLQIEVGPGSVRPDGPWIDFFKGILADRLAGNEWSIFLPGSYLEFTVRQALQQLIDGFKPADVQVYVGARYSNANARASIDVDILGIYNGLPDPLPQLQVHPHIPIGISVSSGTIQVDVGLPDIQTFIERLIPAWAQLFIHLTGPAGALLGALIHSLTSSVKNPDLPAGVVRTSPENLRFTKAVNLPQLLNGVVPSLSTLLAQHDGIAFAGSLRARPFTNGTLSITSHPFKLHPPGINCGGAGIELVALFGEAPESFDILSAQIFVEYDGTLPVYLCSVTPTNDPLGVFPAASLRPDSPQTNATITVHPPVPPPAYYEPGPYYPCDILVKTTAGLRLVRIAPPPRLTQQDVDRLKALLLAELGNCEMLVDPWFTKHHRYNPLWSVDPPREVDVMHLWQVEVNGLAQHQTVTLAGVGEHSLVTSQGQTGQQIRLSALLSPSAANASELSIVRGGELAHGAAFVSTAHRNEERQTHERRGIAVNQQLLLKVGSIPLGQTCKRLAAARIQGCMCVVAVLDDAATAFDVTNPKSVYKIGHWNTPGVRGVVNRAGGLILFGEDGFTAIDDTGRQTVAACGCDADGVLDVAVGDGRLYAALPNMIGVFSQRLCRIGTIAIHDCGSLVRIGNSLVAAVDGGLTIVDLQHHREPKLHPMCADLHVAEVRSGPPTEPGTMVTILEDGTARMLAIYEGRIEEIASFPSRPWFLDTLRVGDLLVRIVGNSLELHQFGSSETQ